MSRSSVIVICVAVLFAATVVWDARRKRRHERHTLAWLAVSLAVILLAIWREAIDDIARLIGVYYPPAALFFFSSVALLWLLYRQSIQIGELNSRLKQLAQEMALSSPKSPSEIDSRT